MTMKEQYELLKKISSDLCGIFDGIYGEFDDEMNEAIQDVERNISTLMNSYTNTPCRKGEVTSHTSYSNCYILRDREDGEVIVKAYDKEKADVMMRDVSKVICFSDCDDTFEVIKIVYHGREVEYAGWRPGMEMAYYFSVTGDPAWSCCVPEWDH